MGLCSSSDVGTRWDERWFSKSDKIFLHQFCEKEMKKKKPIAALTGTQGHGSESPPEDKSGKVLRAVAKDGEFRNWAATVRTAPAKVFTPKSVKEVQSILAQARAMNPPPRIRCMGSSHSWTHFFADDEGWLIDTKGLSDITWSADPHPTQVTIGPGVMCDQLATYLDSKARGKWRGMFVASDVVLGSVTYGGTINCACHGAGKTQTLPDYVLGTSIIKWDGTQVELNRADDPEGFALKVVHFGLLGVSVGFTLKLDDKRTAVRVTDSKLTARDVFLEKDELPKAGGANPLRELYNRHFAVEIMYFPASSLKITNLTSNEFEDQKWDSYSDVCALKTFQRTDNVIKKDKGSWCGADKKTSTRFDRNFSITDWLTINIGTELALPLVAKYGDKPSVVSLYSKTAVKAVEPRGQTSGEVSYETSLAQAIHWQKYITDGFPVSDTEVCIKCDPDFTSAYKAVHSSLGIIKNFAEVEDTMPLNVALEMRFTKHSDSPLSPAYGKEGDIFIWIEVLSAVGTPRLKDFTTRIADAWLAITLKDGSKAARPHWAKWSESYVDNADSKMKRAYADRLPLLQRVVKEFDPNGMFLNNYFSKLFSQ